MEQPSRRDFFRLFGGALAVSITPSIIIPNILEIPVEFGWTWFIKPDDIPVELNKNIRNIMSQNVDKIYNNTARDKHLLIKLNNKDVRLNLTYITEQEQTERMNKRMQDRFIKKEQDRIEQLIKNRSLNKESEQWIRNKSKLALNNKYSYEDVRDNEAYRRAELARQDIRKSPSLGIFREVRKNVT